MALDIEKCQAWLRKRIVDHGDAKRACRVIKMFHVQGDQRQGSVAEYPIGPDENINNLTAQIASDAQNDATGQGETAQFQLLAYYGTHDKKVTSSTAEGGRLVFYMESLRVASPEGGMTATYSPDAKGHLKQMMDHTQSMMQMTVGATTDIHRRMSYIIDSQQEALKEREKTIARLENDRIRMIVEYEKTLSEDSKRELERAEAYARIKQQEKLMAGLVMIAPIIINKLMGKRLLPEAMDARAQEMKALVRSILDNPEQIGAIAATMSVEQQLVFKNVLLEFQAEQDNEEKAEQKDVEKTLGPAKKGFVQNQEGADDDDTKKKGS